MASDAKDYAMSISEIEDAVISYFRGFDVVAKKIKESELKTPDFIIHGKENVLIELKEKFDAEEVYKEKVSILEGGGVFQSTQTTGYKKTISKIIAEAKEQLKAQKENTNSKYCFLFVVARGVNPSAQVEQFESTFYGRKSIIDLESTSNQAVWCYYFTHSVFYRYRDVIDGAFIVNGKTKKASLLINDKSSQYECLLLSEFLSKFKGGIDIVDPKELSAINKIFIADTVVPRGNEEAVKKHVFEKYGISNGIVMDFPTTVFSS
ncbi:hypothetical protein [Saccharophagus degradans]|uniref:Uncharacterized protein n=1 Tax=Saccharophagus degradans TaxID=86304 RepID=A0AAW7XA75_9GAMM|nr:hypothetical protein [Saccharophagus degradans]MDO6424314.1 hypothetical protein [Saccharophagus degradans]MDO6608479.1 hypothetical protein [Saccharophagus degradans]